VHLERADVSDSSGQQADESPESVATTMLSSTSKSLDAEVVQLSDDVPSLQWDTADLTSALLHHDLHACEYMQGGPKKRGHRLMTIVLSNLNRFKKNHWKILWQICSTYSVGQQKRGHILMATLMSNLNLPDFVINNSTAR